MLKRRREKGDRVQQEISFPRLVFQALPEMWTSQFISKTTLVFMVFIFSRLLRLVVSTRAAAITTSNLGDVLLGWQGIALLVMAVAFSLVYTAMDLFSQMLISDDILKGDRVGIIESFKRGFKTIPKLLNPAGLSILVYIFIAVPLVGIGFTVRITRNFHIPNFIMSVITGSTLYSVLYLLAIFLLALAGLFYIFSTHAIVLKGMGAKEAKKYSVRLMRKNWKKFLKSMILVLFACFAVRILAAMIFDGLPTGILENVYDDIPSGYDIAPIEEIARTGELSDMDAYVLKSRVLSAFFTMEGSYLDYVVRLLTSAFVMLYFTRLFLRFDRAETEDDASDEVFLERPKRSSYFLKVATMVGIAVALLFVSIYIGLLYDELMDGEKVPVVAHRCGGFLASENSIDGLYAAIEHDCYGSETDVQRTKDGFYVINHDDTFKRLTGVNKASQDMTLEEVKQLRIQDTTGSGKLLEVPTLDEFLDVTKDNDTLFIELKGKTADKQMVDDVVDIVKKHDCVDQVVLISLKYDVIDYAESTYPEFETGLLLFAGLGEIENLNCDILITEEEMTSDDLVLKLHEAGKKSMIWTVNEEEDLYKFLDMDVDGIITDTIELAEDVQKQLDNRSEVEVIKDSIGDIWN
ncbi:MAG: glycerophosphoryl diester phosphodiesterase membrane domain-containing protein [Lachnospiraceae bacterium]|nr:glycerophosphoryl diester phosphodiesterase membrane domain-containing protein [Lachnospiraceae bacterium]